MRLTDLLIRSLKAPKKGQKTFFDDALPGFGVRVSLGGTKSFIVMYGKERRLRTIGRYPDVALAYARKKAKQVHGEAFSGRAGTSSTVSFAEARERFLEDSRARTKPSTIYEYHRLLHKHFPLVKPLAAVSRQDIMEIVTALRDKASLEQHAFVAIRTMMNWCLRHGLVEASPVPPLRFKTLSQTRILTDEELKAVWYRAAEIGYPYGSIVQLLVLTGQRRGEIAGLRRSWIKDDEVVFPQGFT